MTWTHSKHSVLRWVKAKLAALPPPCTGETFNRKLCSTLLQFGFSPNASFFGPFEKAHRMTADRLVGPSPGYHFTTFYEGRTSPALLVYEEQSVLDDGEELGREVT